MENYIKSQPEIVLISFKYMNPILYDSYFNLYKTKRMFLVTFETYLKFKKAKSNTLPRKVLLFCCYGNRFHIFQTLKLSQNKEKKIH